MSAEFFDVLKADPELCFPFGPLSEASKNARHSMSMGFLSLGLEVLDALAQQLSSALLPGCNATLNQIGTVPERQIERPPTLNCEYSVQ